MPQPHPHNRGFVALIAVIMASLTMLAFSLIALDAAAGYSDMADRRELRIQAGLNAEACLDTATLMVNKDYFLNGTTTVPEFGCVVNVKNSPGNVSLNAKATLEGVSAYGSRELNLNEI
jgi:hypothetical protein